MGTEYKVSKIHTHTVNKQSENKIFKIPFTYNSIKKETKILRINVMKHARRQVYRKYYVKIYKILLIDKTNTDFTGLEFEDSILKYWFSSSWFTVSR